jgi:TRAP transporter TAXI family solute receptor
LKTNFRSSQKNTIPKKIFIFKKKVVVLTKKDHYYQKSTLKIYEGNEMSLSLVRFLWLLVLGIFILFPSIAKALELQEIEIGSGDVVGVYYPVANSICQFSNNALKTLGFLCVVKATNASEENILNLQSGKLALGFSQLDILANAYAGTGFFEKGGAIPELRVLFSLQPELLSIVVKEDSNILSFSQLIKKKPTIHIIGSGTRNTLELLAQEFSFNLTEDVTIVEVKSNELTRALCEKKIDAFLIVVGHPSSIIQETASLCSAKLLPLNEPLIDSFLEKFPVYNKADIPGGLYKSNLRPIPTFGPRAVLVATSSLREDVAYEITASIFENLMGFL